MAMAGIWKPKAWAQEGLRRHNPGYVDPRNPGNDNLNLNLFRIFFVAASLADRKWLVFGL